MEILKIDPRYQFQYSKGAKEVKPRRKAKGGVLPQKEKTGQAPKEEGLANSPPAGDATSHREVEKMREKVAERIKEYLRYQNWSVDLFIHEATQSIAAKIVDNDTSKVIKQIPPEEVLNFRARFMELIRELMGREKAER